MVERNPDYFAAIEVKGGEGNSINISTRPMFAREFCVWCHLDGAIVNQPAHGAHAIINRITNELTVRHKLVDVVFFKDILCGTRTRPCPKYPGREGSIGLMGAPDIFFFPQRIPSLDDPEPPVHTLNTLRLPGLILELFGVPASEQHRHIWEARIKLIPLQDRRLIRETEVWHDGAIVSKSKSRPW